MSAVIQLASGAYFNFEHPYPDSFTIEDIAEALSKLCRFTGHCRRFYSVAEHSVLVSTLVPESLALAGLLHDAAEAFIGDVSSPLKQLLPDYQAIEHRLHGVVDSKFGVSTRDPEIKKADLQALALERYHMLPRIPGDGYWDCVKHVNPEHFAWRPAFLYPTTAKSAFLTRYDELVST